MKSDVILIDNKGNGFSKASNEAKKVAQYEELGNKEGLQLQLITEEMLSMIRTVTGDIKACFWIENDIRVYRLYLTTETVVDKEMRQLLIDASTSRKNEAADSFLGKLRDIFEEAMASEPQDDSYENLPEDIQEDLIGREIEPSDWDHYEQSVLSKIADDVKIGIRGGVVTMIVTKAFPY